MAQRRIRRERDYTRAFTNILYSWELGAVKNELDLHIEWYTAEMTAAEAVKLNRDLEERIFTILKARYEKRLEAGMASIREIEWSIWSDARFEGVEGRLWSMLDHWESIYKTEQGTDLQMLVNDSQNVHTRIVTKQTDTSMAVLNATVIPSGQRTLDEILEVWMITRSWETCRPVYDDMLHWGKKSTIYVKGDYLYRKTLRALWALIKTYKGPLYEELVKRLWEECHESLDVCAQGHITRLANVMVGFHDAFLSPQSEKEQFQNAMATIANKDVGTDTKIAEAQILMDSYGIAESERSAWLDAF